MPYQKSSGFLTKNGEGDMVLMDIETYSRREEDLALAQRLAAVELARLSGTKDLNIDEFKQNMLEAIDQGAKNTHSRAFSTAFRIEMLLPVAPLIASTSRLCS
jgi:hypothetical protein